MAYSSLTVPMKKSLFFGEGPVDNAYTADMVKNITGYDVQGKQIPVQVVKHEKNIAIVPTDKLGVTATNFDYGYWTKRQRWQNCS